MRAAAPAGLELSAFTGNNCNGTYVKTEEEVNGMPAYQQEEDKDMYLSDQALGALMMALQKSLLEQSDIVPVLKGFKFRLSEQGMMVMNPPLVKLAEENGED